MFARYPFQRNKSFQMSQKPSTNCMGVLVFANADKRDLR